MKSRNAFLIFKKGLYNGHNSQTIADICLNFAPINSLKRTTARHQIMLLFFLNNADFYVFVKKWPATR
jgi:hypothetical protein